MLRLNVELKTLRCPIPRASMRQLHITDNFTFVEREFRDYLTCGVLAARGFIRVRCGSCGHERLVPFSCRRRGWCPSCGGRRMAETAAHLVDHVFPIVPVRQWVLSIPFAFRYRLAYDSGLLSDVLNVFIRVVFGGLRRRARELLGLKLSQCGAVTFVQRCGDALNLAPHFHSLVIQGVYAAKWRPRIVPIPDVQFGVCAHVPVPPESNRHPGSEPDATGSAPPPRRKNYSWSELLKRVFEIDILVCERCGGPVRVIAAIQEPETAQQILNYLGLPSRPPPITPARYERRFHPDDFAS